MNEDILPILEEKKIRDKQIAHHPRLGARMFGSLLADVFSAPAYDCRAVGSNQKPEFAVTRLCSGPREMEKAPAYPPDQAILICVSLTPTATDQWRAIYNGKNVGVTRTIPFAATFLDLSCSMEMWVRGPFDYLHYYLSRELLERIARDNAVASLPPLREAFFVEDLVLAQITKNILSPIRRGEPLDRLALDQMATLLGAHTLQAHCDTLKFAVPRCCGLEPWQKLRTEEMLRAHLEGNITLSELAAACSLSPGHFGRCFKKTFGTSVHQRLIQLRIEHAKNLLSKTGQTLTEIALSCGFYDQAAFSRAFARIEHVTPSGWRRSNTSCPNGSSKSRLPLSL
ncbi:MAG TPA: AraC family transcriptional regulator [Candidatus Acidoferrales bacterium]|jgi:AraC family transcriptional regulator|nr:AraC family transcriptional regulator [Candidatus Acidoferrales bacterium]